MSKKNILELCLSPGLGGLELFTIKCFNDFKEKTNCKIVVAPNEKLDSYLGGKDVFHLKRNKFFPIIPAYRLSKYIDENDIDIIHFHWTKDIITAVLAKLLSKKKPKLVQTRHMGMTRFKDDIYHQWIYKNIDAIHTVSKLVKEQVVKYIPEDIRPRLEALYLGTEVPATITDKERIDFKDKYNLGDSFVVGAVGRIEEEKGQHLVIDAIKNLKDENIDVKALIVGHTMDNEYLEQLKSDVSSKGLGNDVIFTGFTKEAQKLMQLCDCLVLATYNETFGLVLIEAMASEVAVIASNKGGPLEIIDDNVNGLLFESKNYKSLRDKIKNLLDEDKRKQLAKAGKQKTEDVFESKKQFEKLYNFLKQI